QELIRDKRWDVLRDSMSEFDPSDIAEILIAVPIMLHLDANACERLDSLAIGNLRVYQICMVLRRSAIASSSFGAFFCGLQCEFDEAPAAIFKNSKRAGDVSGII